MTIPAVLPLSFAPHMTEAKKNQYLSSNGNKHKLKINGKT
jgi:hypothetical protein